MLVFRDVQMDQGSYINRVKNLIKNPLLAMPEEISKEIKYILEFVEIVGWVREHINKKINIKELLQLLEIDILKSNEILSKAYGIINIFF